MIFLLLLLDILVNNYTKYTSFFFIIFLYNKPYKFYLLTGLILDFVIFNTLFYNTIILSIMYFLNMIFKELNKKNIYNFTFFCIYNYILYIFLTNIVMLNSINNILVLIGSNLFINIVFYVLSFRIIKKLSI